MEDLPLLMLGLPKGSLEDATVDLFAKAGFQITKSSRSYRPAFDDEQLDGRFVRAQEVSRYVELGYFDCGLTGQDWVRENGSDIVEVCDLVYSRASNRRSKWILAVPEQSAIETVKDLEGKRIATEVVNITKQYLQKNSVNAEVEFSWGATEVKVPDLVDAIVDLTETGNSLVANKLRIVDTLMFTNTVLIANKSAWETPEKRKKIDSIAMLLRSALEAKSKVGLKLNVERAKLDELLEDLPALRNPTVNRLADESWVAIDTILDEKVVREIIPALKAHGAEGIVEYPLNKVVY
ncbi:MAG: ATP phosphoribosyltransferase [Verrucomicrobiota bacterium]|nr:ATP phosphoribosyltransferase [Verrucomicrobiota bacterium]